MTGGHFSMKSPRYMRTVRDGPHNPSEDPEFVLLHVDGVDSMGFASHYKMPHYVTFQSDMDRLRTTQGKVRKSGETA